jgi:hypothetical protein
MVIDDLKLGRLVDYMQINTGRCAFSGGLAINFRGVLLQECARNHRYCQIAARDA